MRSSNKETINKLLKQKNLIYCLEGDNNLSKENEQRVKKINEILSRLTSNISQLKKTNVSPYGTPPHGSRSSNVTPNRSPDYSIDSYPMGGRRKRGYGFDQNNLGLQNTYQRSSLSSRIRKTNEEIFIDMCYQIKNEKKENPNLFHFISNISPGSLEFKINVIYNVNNRTLSNRGNRLRNDQNRNRNKWWYVSLGTNDEPDKQKTWLLFPPENFIATDISDYCKKYGENEFRDLFDAIKDVNKKLGEKNDVRYTINTEGGLKENILHIRFTPFSP